MNNGTRCSPTTSSFRLFPTAQARSSPAALPDPTITTVNLAVGHSSGGGDVVTHNDGTFNVTSTGLSALVRGLAGSVTSNAIFDCSGTISSTKASCVWAASFGPTTSSTSMAVSLRRSAIRPPPHSWTLLFSSVAAAYLGDRRRPHHGSRHFPARRCHGTRHPRLRQSRNPHAP